MHSADAIFNFRFIKIDFHKIINRYESIHSRTKGDCWKFAYHRQGSDFNIDDDLSLSFVGDSMLSGLSKLVHRNLDRESCHDGQNETSADDHYIAWSGALSFVPVALSIPRH